MTGTSWRTGLCHCLAGHGGLHSDKMNSWPQIKGGLRLHRPGHHKRGRRALAPVQQAHMVTETGQDGQMGPLHTPTPPPPPQTEERGGRGHRLKCAARGSSSAFDMWSAINEQRRTRRAHMSWSSPGPVEQERRGSSVAD